MRNPILPFIGVALLGVATLSPAAETWRTHTIAGTGEAGHSGDGGPADKAKINNPFGVVRGPDGLIYFCEYDGQVIRRIDSKGLITTIAGTGGTGYSGDGGPATRATMNKPHEIRFDSKGDLFFTDMANHVIRKVDMKSGVISTVAGTGKAGFSGDGGAATKAQLKQPHSLAFGPDGHLYICDIGNHRIRRVHKNSGVIQTIAGNGKRAKTPDGGKFRGAPLNGPRTIDFDRNGSMWLALREGNQVWRLDIKRGTIHHIAGTGKKGFTGNGGPAKTATLSGPKGIAIAPNGDIYLCDTESHSIRMVDVSTGNLELVCGTGEKGDGPDGDPLKCRMGRPHGVWVDPDGAVFIGDSLAHRVREMRRVR